MLDVRVTLRVFSTVESLSALKETLGEPTKGFSTGDVKPGGKGVREKTYWALETSCAPGSSLESHLVQIISFLDSRVDVLSRLRLDCEVDLFCMLSTTNGQGGALLSDTVMRRLVAYELSLVFDVYSD
jgi:Domain of unknown function (DUF4279)